MKKTLSFILVVALLAMTCTTAFADAANPFLYPDDSPLNNTITDLTLSAIREIEDF